MKRLVFLLSLVTLIAGITPVAAKLALNEFPPFTVAGIRFLVAGCLLWVTLRLRGRRLAIPREEFGTILLLAVICVPINQFGFLVGIQKANASHGGLFYALSPVLVFWISVALRRIAFDGRMLVAALLAATGAIAVLKPAGSAAGGSMITGDALLLLAVSSWALFLVLSRPVIARLGALRTITATFLVGALLHAPLVSIDAGDWPVAGGSPRAWAGMAFITLVTCYLNYLLVYLVLARYEATRATIVINGSFLITATIGWLWLGEPMSGGFIVGAALIVGAILLDAWRGMTRGTVSR